MRIPAGTSRTACLAAALLMVAPVTHTVGAQRAAPSSLKEALLRAEDARGHGPEGIRPITDALRSPALLALAIRAIGRLEQPELVRLLPPFLDDDDHREAAGEAIAQGLRGITNEASPRGWRAFVDSMADALAVAAHSEVRASVRGSLARSLARLPFDDPRQARLAEEELLGLVEPGVEAVELAPALIGVAHGLYTIARNRRTLGDLTPGSVVWLRRVAAGSSWHEAFAPARRLAWLALTASGGADGATVDASAADSDPQVRRLVVAALPNVADTAVRRQVLARAAADPSHLVRLEWVRVYRQVGAARDCRPLFAALQDANPHVQLAAIDALGAPCPARDSVVPALRRLADAGPTGPSPRLPGQLSWHTRGHALAALARVDARGARSALAKNARHPVWQVRLYVARGAATVRDSVLLTTLALDEVGSVREVALQGLSATIGHRADRTFLRALSSRDYHVVLAAARALKGVTRRDSVLPAVLDNLERLTRERRQTSRDPRMELLARVSELADRRSVTRLAPLLRDIDPAIAREARAVIEKLAPGTAGAVQPTPVANPLSPASGTVRVRVTMSRASGGGTFDLSLDGDRAPMTVARVVALINQRYYDGLSFHRVVPNFVIQGGSPGMNEYVGDGHFMRDELSLAHHARSTVGISTRGRDTGDAQWFVNLVDNYRLDHDYTVFGSVVAGLDIVDGILEGDIMESVRVVGSGPPAGDPPGRTPSRPSPR